MDIFGRKLYKATVIKAHEATYTCISINFLILADTLDKAKWILLNSIRGWKRHREYELEEEDFATYSRLDKKTKRTLSQQGFTLWKDTDDCAS